MPKLEPEMHQHIARGVRARKGLALFLALVAQQPYYHKGTLFGACLLFHGTIRIIRSPFWGLLTS